MNIRKAAHDFVLSMITRELERVRFKIRDNAFVLRKLSDDQKALKAERHTLYTMVREMKKKAPV